MARAVVVSHAIVNNVLYVRGKNKKNILYFVLGKMRGGRRIEPRTNWSHVLFFVKPP